jgi:hypothetical protein
MMGLCALGVCTALPSFLLGAVQTQTLNLPSGLPLAGYGAAPRRDFLTTIIPFKKWSRYLKSSLGEDEGGIRVSVMVLKDHTKSVVIVSLETVAITAQMRSQILGYLRERNHLEIEDENLFVTATHTHSGPGGLSNEFIWQLAVSDQFLPEVWANCLESISTATKLAINHSVPVQLKWGEVTAQGLSKNRRDDNLQAENLGHGLLMQTLKEQKVLGGFVSFPVHGTAYGPSHLTLSADLPGAMARETEKLFEDSHFLFLSEEAADLAPTKSKKEGIQDLSRSFAQSFHAQSKDFKILGSALQTKSVQVDLGIPKLNLSHCSTWGGFKNKFVPHINLDKFLPMETKVTELSVGDAKFQFWPGEISSRLGAQMRSVSLPNKQTNKVNFTLANDYLGYFLTTEEQNEGGYESCVSFYGSKGSQAFIDASKD